MFAKETYPLWTKAFSPNSNFEGNWKQGSRIKFIGTDENGENMGGMVSRIAEARPYEFMSIEHVGMIDKNGVEDTTSEEVRKWVPAFENYTFSKKDGGTEVLVDQDMQAEYKEMFDAMWPKALETLKELSEK